MLSELKSSVVSHRIRTGYGVYFTVAATTPCMLTTRYHLPYEYFATALHQIIACYRATSHPSVRRGEKPSAEVRQDFIQTLGDVTEADLHRNRGAVVSFPAFLDFYCSLTAFTSDSDFRCGGTYRCGCACYFPVYSGVCVYQSFLTVRVFARFRLTLRTRARVADDN